MYNWLIRNKTQIDGHGTIVEIDEAKFEIYFQNNI